MLTEHILKIVNTSHQQLVHSKQGGSWEWLFP